MLRMPVRVIILRLPWIWFNVVNVLISNKLEVLRRYGLLSCKTRVISKCASTPFARIAATLRPHIAKRLSTFTREFFVILLLALLVNLRLILANRRSVKLVIPYKWRFLFVLPSRCIFKFLLLTHLILVSLCIVLLFGLHAFCLLIVRPHRLFAILSVLRSLILFSTPIVAHRFNLKDILRLWWRFLLNILNLLWIVLDLIKHLTLRWLTL